MKYFFGSSTQPNIEVTQWQCGFLDSFPELLAPKLGHSCHNIRVIMLDLGKGPPVIFGFLRFSLLASSCYEVGPKTVLS